MEYLVTMTTHVPDGTSEGAVADVRAARLRTPVSSRRRSSTMPGRARRGERTSWQSKVT
jgi:muconolactone delta-isomerase